VPALKKQKARKFRASKIRTSIWRGLEVDGGARVKTLTPPNAPSEAAYFFFFAAFFFAFFFAAMIDSLFPMVSVREEHAADRGGVTAEALNRSIDNGLTPSLYAVPTTLEHH